MNTNRSDSVDNGVRVVWLGSNAQLNVNIDLVHVLGVGSLFTNQAACAARLQQTLLPLCKQTGSSAAASRPDNNTEINIDFRCVRVMMRVGGDTDTTRAIDITPQPSLGLNLPGNYSHIKAREDRTSDIDCYAVDGLQVVCSVADVNWPTSCELVSASNAALIVAAWKRLYERMQQHCKKIRNMRFVKAARQESTTFEPIVLTLTTYSRPECAIGRLMCLHASTAIPLCVWQQFEAFSEDLRKNKRVAQVAVVLHPESYFVLPESLLNDRDLLLSASERGAASLLHHASARLRDCSDTVVELCKRDIMFFAFASERLRSDPQTVRTIFDAANKGIGDSRRADDVLLFNSRESNNLEAFLYIGEKLKHNKGFMRQAVTRWRGYYLKAAALRVRNDRKTAVLAIQNDALAMYFVSVHLKTNDSFVKMVADVKPEALMYNHLCSFSAELVAIIANRKADLILDAIPWPQWSIVDSRSHDDKAAVLEAVQKDPKAMRFASDRLSRDPRFAVRVAKVNARALSWCSNLTKAVAEAAAKWHPDVVVEWLLDRAYQEFEFCTQHSNFLSKPNDEML